MIPFEKLDDPQNLKDIDPTYFLVKCREVLKCVYDNGFKNHNIFKDLKNLLTKDELQQKLVQQVFLSGVRPQ